MGIDSWTGMFTIPKWVVYGIVIPAIEKSMAFSLPPSALATPIIMCEGLHPVPIYPWHTGCPQNMMGSQSYMFGINRA